MKPKVIIQGSAMAPDSRFPRVKLVERQDITTNLMVIKLEPENKPFNFKAGQYCTLGMGIIERVYSIVSVPLEPLLEIFVELVPEGELTSLMWQLMVGDHMCVRPRAKGIFTLDERARHHFQVATVTGVAPFVSMIRSYLHNGRQDNRFYLLLEASYQDDLFYDLGLNRLAQKARTAYSSSPPLATPTN